MLKTPGILAADKLKDFDVTNNAGKDLGKIEDLMVDLERGRITYAVLSFGGFLGLGGKLFAIPWEALKPSLSDEKFILEVDKETLKNAPGLFERESWPDMTDRDWANRLYGYYGFRPYWEYDEPVRPVDRLEHHGHDRPGRIL